MRRCPICGLRYPDEITQCPDHGLALIDDRPQDRWLGRRLKEAYQVEALIGCGGMGRVYRATQTPIMRTVAIKTFEAPAGDTRRIKRFYREARLLGSISHCNVVTIFDFGNTEDGELYLVMEYLEGTDLQHSVPADVGLPVRDAVRLFDQLCKAVAALHSVEMVHRDIKPDNVFIARQTGGGELLKLLDFGIAKDLGRRTTITDTRMVLGTPGYMAPELIGASSSNASRQSDIYALGAVLYFLLTGLEAHPAGTAQHVLARQLASEMDLRGLAARSDVHPKLLELLILKAMSLEPAARHASCEELLAAFRYATSAR